MSKEIFELSMQIDERFEWVDITEKNLLAFLLTLFF
jgi:hypothetical protein